MSDVEGGIGAEAAAGERLPQIRRVLWFVLVANLFVVLVKVLVGLRAGSLAVLGDAAHSGVDSMNNVVGLLAGRRASLR